jgi:hypothetical protein
MKLRLSVSISHDATHDELLFARQLGAECVYTWVPDSQMDVTSRLQAEVVDRARQLRLDHLRHHG